MLSALALSACFSYQAASSGPIGCPAADIEIRNTRLSPGIHGPTRTWTAICSDSEHLCSAAAGGGAACTRTDPVGAELAANTRAANWLVRGFDSEQQTPSIGAHARIDVRRWIELSARPRTDARIDVTMRLLKHRGVACDSVRWSINGTPQPIVPAQFQDEGPTHRVTTTVGNDFIRELERPHPSLSIRACGQLVAIERTPLDTLVAFAKAYADLATNKELPSAATPAPIADQGAP